MKEWEIEEVREQVHTTARSLLLEARLKALEARVEKLEQQAKGL